MPAIDATAPPEARFGWVVAGRKVGPDNLFDQDLANFKDAAIVPSKGALVPEWLLVVPRLPCCSVAQLSASTRKAVWNCATRVSDVVEQATSETVIFEHGASKFGSLHGCGVDQAHLHVVGLPGDFVGHAKHATPGLTWRPTPIVDPWEGVEPGSDYLLLASRSEAWIAEVIYPTSQLLRRCAATFLRRDEEWSYKIHPQAANAAKTVCQFAGSFPASHDG